MVRRVGVVADETGFAAATGPLRREILAHCYRMLGSAADAEDAVQESFLRAWRGYGRFEGRSSVRTWLHQIATNVCLRQLEQRGRRALPAGLGPPEPDWVLRARPAPAETRWAGPLPVDPADAAGDRQWIRLAFIAALQHLPARQRAVLILRDVAAGQRAAVAREVSPPAGIDREPGDAVDEAFADKVLAVRRPDLLVITAGAVPAMRPLTGQTWETFSVNWHTDVRIAFTWLRAALRLPLAPGSRVVVFGSAAELRGSPLSGGYAGAKATVRLITGYAAAEAKDLDITMTTVLPVITPGTTIGETAIQAYAAASGSTPEAFRANLTGAPSPESVGAAVVALTGAGTYLVDASGLRPLAIPPA